MSILLWALGPAAARDCVLHPRALHRAGTGRAVTVLHPRPFPAEVLAATAARIVAAPGGRSLPPGPVGSRLGPEVTPAARLVWVTKVLLFLETGGIHAGPDGRVIEAGVPGRPAGWLQLSEPAAREAGAWGRELGLAGLEGDADPAALRLEPAWNLRLGVLYLGLLVGRVARADEPGGLAWLRAMVAWVGGEDQPYLAGPAATFLAGVAARPEVKRYLRQGAFALGLGDEPFLSGWKTPLSGRVTRLSGGWRREAARIRREFERLFLPCRR